MSTAPQPNRITAILCHPEAVGRETLAAHLALETTMTASAVIAALERSPRSGEAGASGAAATAGAAVARALLGLPSNPEADLALGKSIADAHAIDIAERASANAESAKFDKEYAEGRAAAERLLGKSH